MARMNGVTGVIVSSIAVIVVVVVGWFVFVSPQRSKADKLDTQKAAVDTELISDQALLAAPRQKATKAAIAAAERAMPDTPQVSNLLRELNGFATKSRTELDSISPTAPVPVGSAEAIPISLSFKGPYFGLQKLLQLLRESADVKNNKLIASGRLYSVDSITFTGGSATGTSADITATIALNAFVYGAPAVVPTPAAAPTDTTAAEPTG